jgi:hypothetical protein
MDSRCKALPDGEVSYGKVRDLSCTGAFMATTKILDAGTHVELSMDWPFRLHDSGLGQLRVLGDVVRSDQRGMAVSIVRYEFAAAGPDTAVI